MLTHDPVIDLQVANRATAVRFVDAFNRADWDTVREVVAGDFVFHHPVGGTVAAGPEGMVAAWAGFRQLSPDSWHPIPILVAEGDHAAVLLPTYGHFTGRAESAPPPTGGRLDYGMVNIVRFEGGRLAELWFGMDPLVELQQLGVAPTPPSRTLTATERANVAAFLAGAGREPDAYDTVTAFGDDVIAFAPPQSSPGSTCRSLEVHRVADGRPSPRYRHELATVPSYGGDPSVDTERSRTLVDRWFGEIVGEQRVDALPEVASPTVLVHPTAMPCEAGAYAIAGLERWLRETWSAFPDLDVVERFTVASGDIVATRWLARGTANGPFLGIAPTGRQVELTGISMVRVEDDRIAEIWETRNTLGILRQLDPRIGGGHHH